MTWRHIILIGIDADGESIRAFGRVNHAGAGRAGDGKIDVRPLVDQRQGILLTGGGIGERA